MSIRDLTGLAKFSWVILLFGLLGVEIRSINNDKEESNNKQKAVLKEERDSVNTILRQNQNHFDATMRPMETLLESSTTTLTNLNRNLLQTMGGAGYPIFLPLFPSNHPSKEELWPVMVIYHLADQNDKQNLPLVNVSVDVREEFPPKRIAEVDVETRKRVLESQFHPTHFDFGTLVQPSSFITPIRLRPGRRYEFTITTRRGLFREYVNIDSPGGGGGSWCLYRYHDNKLLAGKCD